MAINDHQPISAFLSGLLKKSLTTLQAQHIADKYKVHYNTIINIRDRRKKAPDKLILKDMIKMAIINQKSKIKTSNDLITFLEIELKKIE
ncbi:MULTISPECIES: hypothetical protein [Aquimarina]|uniref:hypothetical protein n=1 Tax=Aquimarina TaxID=290174 RepID=UPI000CDE8364|nr:MULTISPECIES: hypothetical protein [Aquimarina]